MTAKDKVDFDGFRLPDAQNPAGEFGGVVVHRLQRFIFAHLLAFGSCHRHLNGTAKQLKDGRT